MRPIQLWLPTLTDSLSRAPSQRDAQRAMQAWKGECRVWLLPDLKKEVRSEEPIGDGNGSFRVLAIPAETLDCVDVFHIGENGQVWGQGSAIRFPAGSTDSLLKAWLNLFSLEDNVSLSCAPDSIILKMPHFRGKKIKYKKARVRLMPGPTLPVAKVNKRSLTLRMKWPPEGGMPASISPEAESVEHYGPMQRADRDGLSIAISRRDPKIRSLHAICRLPRPFEKLLPCGAGIETLNGYAEMREIIRQSARDPEGALQKAKNAAGGYLSEGQTTQQMAWFLPTFSKEGVKMALHHALFRWNLPECETAEEAMRSSAWQREMGKLVPVRRAWGLLGLLWALLIDQLEIGKKFQACERCDRLFIGKRGKRFCGPEDSKVCFRKRRAADKRTERMRHSQVT